MNHSQHTDLEQLLVNRAIATPMQIESAHTASRCNGHSWVEHLVLGGVIDDRTLCRCIAELTLVPPCEDTHLARVPPQVLALVPGDLAIEHRLCPVHVGEDGDLSVAMLDPTDREAIEEVGFFVARRLMRMVARASSMSWALHAYYGATD
jgi:hypothetical protein